MMLAAGCWFRRACAPVHFMQLSHDISAVHTIFIYIHSVFGQTWLSVVVVDSNQLSVLCVCAHGAQFQQQLIHISISMHLLILALLDFWFVL